MKLRNILLLGITVLMLTGCSFSLAEDITPPPDYQSPTPGPTESPLFPQATPNLENGQAIFIEKCAPCHGEKGLGDGPMAAQLQKQPAAIGSAELGGKAVLVNWFTTVTQGNINSFMPPFKDSLSDQDRWDVVSYALSFAGYSGADAANGKAIYDANCSQCHGTTGNLIPTSDFNDQALMSKLSQNDIKNFIVNGVGRMPGFGATIDDAQLASITNYVRSFTIPAIQTSEPEVVPTTSATEATATVETMIEPSVTQESVQSNETPAVDAEATLVPTDVTATSEPESTATTTATLGTISGSVKNGSGSALPADLIVTLHGFSHNVETQQFNEILTQDGKVGSDGSFSFKDISFTDAQAFYTSVEYSGSTYNSDPGFVEPGKNALELPLNVFDTTTDTSTLKADQVHLLLDYSKTDVVQVIEFLIFSNTGTKSIVASEAGGAIINIPLPKSYTNLQFESGAIGDRYLKTTDGFADTTAINPGTQQHQIVFSVDLPLSKANLFGGRSVDIEQVISFPATQVTILAPEGITVKGSNVTAGGLTDMGNGAKYLTYTVTLAEPNKQISITVNGTPSDSKISSSNSNIGIIIGIGSLGVVLILAGVWMYLRNKNPQAKPEQSSDDDDPETDPEEEALLDDILALEDQFKSGNLEEFVYKSRRKALTDQLKKLKS